ncbi:hypothetical protein Tco_1540300 [Tanacetum coccineum]
MFVRERCWKVNSPWKSRSLMKFEEVNANCILMANLQQASTTGTQTDKAPVYDSDGQLIDYPLKPSREEKYVPNKVRASVRTTPITVSQPHVVTKKDVNSDSNGLSSTEMERRNRTLVEAARTMLIFSHAPLFLWAEALLRVAYTTKRSIQSPRFNKTPIRAQITAENQYLLFYMYLRAHCYPKNDREEFGKLGAKGFLQSKSKKIMETMNVTFDELSDNGFLNTAVQNPGRQSILLDKSVSGIDLLMLRNNNKLKNQLKIPRTMPTYLSTINPHEIFNGLDHPLESRDRKPSPSRFAKDQLLSDGDMCMNALTVSTVEPKNVKDSMTYLHGMINARRASSVQKSLIYILWQYELHTIVSLCFKGRETAFLHGNAKRRRVRCQPIRFPIDADHSKHVYKVKEGIIWVKATPRATERRTVKFHLQNHFSKALLIQRSKPTRVALKEMLTDAGCKDPSRSTSGGAQFIAKS